MGPPRSVVMRSTINNGSRSMMRPPMGSNYRPLGMGSLGSTIGLHRRGTTTRGRISHYRSDGRRGMLSTRMLGSTHHRRLDMRPPLSLHNRRYPSLRGRGDGRSRLSIGTKRTFDTTKVSRGVLIKRALQAAKDLDDDALSDNDDEEDEDDEDDDAAEEEDEPTPKKVKKAPAAASDDEEDADDKDAAASGQADGGESKKKKEDNDANTTASTVADGDESASPKKTPVKKKIVASGSSEKPATESSAADAEDVEKRQSRKITTKYRTSTFIKLNCVHCSMNCVTFKEYQMHLYSRQHKIKMREVFDNCNARVLEMRAAQRNAQKDEDQKSEDGDGEGKTTRASFCIICKLNYRQPRATHQQSEAHKQMKKYLMPFCTVCRVSCRSPIAYENHRVSLDHLKNKARVERYSSKVNEDTDDDTQVDLGELVNLGNLTTVDEVGKVDEICEGTGGTAESTTASGAAAKKRREAIRADTDDDDDDDEDDDDDNGDELQMIIGEEHVKKVEVQYCELCNIYLPRRMESQEKALRDHCKKRSHLKLYIRYRNDKKLREKAERIHKKKLKGDKEAANAKKDDEKATGEATESGAKSVAAAAKSSTVSSSSVTVTASDKKNETTGGDSGASKDASTGKGNAEGSQGTTGTAEGGKSGTGGASNDTAANASQAEDQSDEIWQVVDNDELGDLLRGVAEVDEEDDDKEAMLERYDKFRHTEKNGIEQQSAAASAASGTDAGDSATSKAVGAAGTNGGGNAADAATNGDNSSSKEVVKAEG
uniref:Putative transcriptional regulator atrx n=1 Tax=Anopheles triannulatus TaxID=58253 RepID=A0A2M4ADV7_9DIPT